jgi:DNA-binding CsgD family transcriptional regulator
MMRDTICNAAPGSVEVRADAERPAVSRDDAHPDHRRDQPGQVIHLGRKVEANLGAPSAPPERPGRLFLDRRAECAELDGLIRAVRAGESRALLLTGEPGVGKTALLDYLVSRASGCRVLRGAGTESEIELAFGGLHQVCAPLLGRADQLPDPQRDALRVAFGLATGPQPDRFLVGLAALGLLADAATERPVVCVLDDAQWSDRASAQALAFAARRLGAESLALVFAAHDGKQVPELAGMPQLQVHGLAETEARALLDSVLPGRVDERVLDRIVAESRGNPLALLELPKGLSAPELAGGFDMPVAVELPRRIEGSFRRQLAALPSESRRLMLVASAEPLGDPVLMWRSAERLGIEEQAATPAAESGLMTIDSRVRFRHPLLRSVVYRTSSVEERRAVHRALAEETDPEAEPEHHSWHAAQALSGPNEEVASALERSATSSRARGGLAAAAAFLERAAQLTPDPGRRAERRLAAARATHQAGCPEAALRLLCLAEAGPLNGLGRARAGLLRGQIAFISRSRDAAAQLWSAATRLEPLAPRLARDTYVEAISAVWLVGPVTSGINLRELVRAAHAAPAAEARPVDLLVEGLASRLTDGYAAGFPILKRALLALRGLSRPGEEAMQWLHLASATAGHVWDDESWQLIAVRHIRLARECGAFAMLVHALNMGIAMHTCLGELESAASLAQERAALIDATGSTVLAYGGPMLAAWQGREAEAEQIFEVFGHQVVRRGEGQGVTILGWARALLYNALSRYEDALAAAQPASEAPPEIGGMPWALRVELIEAASRAGTPDRAAGALEELTEPAQCAGSDWALGILARCQALLGEGETAEHSYQDAIQRLSRTRMRGELARAHLLYGEWLRREHRRLDARNQLRIACEMFEEMGAEAFLQRATRELGATGETLRKRKIETTGELTAQEAQITALVREGLSNPEIGARLFISPRTVEWHLGNIFSKLNVTSRRQINRGSPFSGAVGNTAEHRRVGPHRRGGRKD